jgi:short-subunit dehydrogenase
VPDAARKPTALVTGASSGIGLELARLLARDGHDLVLVARDEARLRALAGELQERWGATSAVLPSDLSRPGAAADLVAQVEAHGLHVDVLVNNAGFGLYGPFAGADPAVTRAMVQVNIAALTELTRALVPGMVARRRGAVLNVASTAAFQPGPLMAVYYATKAYVLSFTEALGNELEGTGVRVTVLCPGPTRTGFQKAARLETSRLVYGKTLADAASVARAGYAGLKRGRRLVIPGTMNRLLAWTTRVVPRALTVRIVRRIQERIHA